MSFGLPHFEKFVSPWVCIGSACFGVTAFVVVLIVLATNRRREEDSR